MSSRSIAVFGMGCGQGICGVTLLLGARSAHMPNISVKPTFAMLAEPMKCLRTMPALQMQLTGVVMRQ